MIILGITDGQHDAGACVFEDRTPIAMINEERLTRVKQQWGFPAMSLPKVLEMAQLDASKVDVIAVAGFLTPPPYARRFRFLQTMEAMARKRRGIAQKISEFALLHMGLNSISPDSFLGRSQRPFLENAFRANLPVELKKKRVYFFEHHLCHAATAYFNSGLEPALCITADHRGDGTSLTVNWCEKGKISRHFTMDADNSFGYLYSAITKYLGFAPYRHEGKILGLAAHGDPDKMKFPFPFSEQNGTIKYDLTPTVDLDRRLRKQLEGHNREDISAWLQVNLEKSVTALVQKWQEKTGAKNLVLAGGLFANVKLNQRLHELPGIENVYVFPHMGDGGLAAGAVQLFTRGEPQRMEHVYWGPEYSDAEMLRVVEQRGLKSEKPADLEKTVAQLLVDGKIIARFDGRMEYGPRALGNRSILYHTTDRTVNTWLNKQLRRTEFMPFAPVTMIEHADKCYENIKGAEFAARFMTITFNCTEWMRQNCPAVVHVDNTARPQLVSREDNPSYYRILEEYHKLTGLPSLVNTSFNMHEEPIVCTPENAVDAFLQSNLDYLILGRNLVAAHDPANNP